MRLGNDFAATASGTLYQMLLTGPYALGFSYIIIVVFKKLSGVEKIPWDRFARVFFTIGILFAFFFALYEYAGGGKRPEDKEVSLPILSDFLKGGNQKQP